MNRNLFGRYNAKSWHGAWLCGFRLYSCKDTDLPSAVYRHVLCVHPYQRSGASLTAFPPLGLEYVAAALRPYAERIELVNFRHQRHPGTRKLVRSDTDLVCYSINWRREQESIAQDIRGLPPNITVILGGRIATEDPGHWLQECPNVSAVVCGDGEQAIVEIATGRPWPEIAGLAYRDKDGQVVHNPPRANAPLDENLLPARDLRPRPYYLTLKGVSTGIKVDMVAGSRGCPYNCKFCDFAMNPWGVKRHWAARSPESIVREIEQIDADVIFFVDDVFTYQPQRVLAICDLLIARGIRKHYIVNARLELARNPEVVARMEQAGFIVLCIGVESTQDATLASMRKGFNTRQIREAFEVLSRSKIMLNTYFILGNIGETEEQMLETAPFARSIGADFIYVSRLRNGPHSGLQTLVDQSPGYHIDDEGFVYSDQYSSRHLVDLRKRIEKQFFSLWHILATVYRLVRVLNWRVRARGALSIPPFLAKLLVTQVARKFRKWARHRAKKRSLQDAAKASPGSSG